ncbi:VMAP-C domain-containing protein [Moorena bouillonii]|uniref:Uncharacterized protein n=1 Tax=Moorena bouillonii PNG TaxID=568701 RepID=A0A1U7MY23_9CYAN|nr:effector-associated domain EAD1-containing protein [Moorena bouillonii]OLT58618.1 hypothetical protein BJP37_05720 [Moorena bouillonii PNG]
MNGGNTPGYLLKEINKALCSAFTSENQLEMMVNYELNIKLKEVASGGNLKEIVHRLVENFDAKNKLGNLIDGALKENPDNPDLKAIKEKFKITTSLIDILRPLEKHFINQMQQAYQACCINKSWDDWENKSPDSLDEILKELDEQPQGTHNEKPIVQFVDHLLKTGDIPNSHADQLNQWIRENANNPSDLLSQSSSHSQNHQQQNLDAQPYLLVKVDSSKQYHQKGQKRYLVSAWFIPDKNNYNYLEYPQNCKFLETRSADGESEQDVLSLKKLENFIKKFLSDPQNNSKFCKNTSIVFSLPYELLNYEIERINITNYYGLTCPMGKHYKVFIRSLKRFERLTHNNGNQKICSEKWKKIKDSRENKCHQEFVDVGKFDFDSERLYAHLKNEKMNKKTIALKLYNPPDYEILKVIDTMEIPVALWLRKNDFKTIINCQDEFDKLFECQINELPKKVEEQRLKAPKKEHGQEHIGHHLALLWEDPDLLPPQIDYTTL